jgi:hypothetical protein
LVVGTALPPHSGPYADWEKDQAKEQRFFSKSNVFRVGHYYKYPTKEEEFEFRRNRIDSKDSKDRIQMWMKIEGLRIHGTKGDMLLRWERHVEKNFEQEWEKISKEQLEDPPWFDKIGGDEISPHSILSKPSQIGNISPIKIADRLTGNGTYYFYKDSLYLGASEEEVLSYCDPVLDSGGTTRDRIPDETQIFVWNRCGGACVKCGSQENLAFDHIIPHSLGGSNSRRNLQLLCDPCNLKKSNKIGG